VLIVYDKLKDEVLINVMMNVYGKLKDEVSSCDDECLW